MVKNVKLKACDSWRGATVQRLSRLEVFASQGVSGWGQESQMFAYFKGICNENCKFLKNG